MHPDPDTSILTCVSFAVRDEAARLRFQTTLMPFLKFRTPRPESIKFVTDFARRTGDLMVLSKPDIHLIALTYDLECERNGGDWRLRKEPGQKSVNGAPPTKEGETTTEGQTEAATAPVTEEKAAEEKTEEVKQVEEQLEKLDIGSQEQETTPAPEEDEEEEEEENDGEASDDDGEWISKLPSSLPNLSTTANMPCLLQPPQTLKRSKPANPPESPPSHSKRRSKQPSSPPTWPCATSPSAST